MSDDKKLYFDPKLKGFKWYADGEAPRDAILTNEEERGLLLIAEREGKQIVVRDRKLRAEVLVINLDDHKSFAKSRINAKAEELITSGFVSDALGTPHFYKARFEDQLNLTGVTVMSLAGASIPLRCTDEAGIYEERLHSPQQMSQVFVAGVMHKIATIRVSDELNAAIDAATTASEIEAVVWPDMHA